MIRRARPWAEVLPLNDPTRVGLALAQADVLAAQGEREPARAQLQALYDALVARHGERDLASMDVLNALASQQRSVGDLAQARASMEKLVPLRVAVQGAERPRAEVDHQPARSALTDEILDRALVAGRPDRPLVNPEVAQAHPERTHFRKPGLQEPVGDLARARSLRLEPLLDEITSEGLRLSA